MCHAYVIVHNLLYVHRVFRLIGNGSISHERLKLSKKYFNKSCLGWKGASYGANYFFADRIAEEILGTTSFF